MNRKLLVYLLYTFLYPEQAVREAKRDSDKLKEREEESLVTQNQLRQIHTEANKMFSSDKQALTEDRDQFSRDVDRIGELSQFIMATLTHCCNYR